MNKTYLPCITSKVLLSLSEPSKGFYRQVKMSNNYFLVHLNHSHQLGQLHRLPSLTHTHNQTQFLFPEGASLCERTRLTRERDPGCKIETHSFSGPPSVSLQLHDPKIEQRRTLCVPVSLSPHPRPGPTSLSKLYFSSFSNQECPNSDKLKSNSDKPNIWN